MAEGHRLLGILTTIYRELGELQCAWFTTYAVDPFLIETYILPLLLGQEKPKDIYDYEALTRQYADARSDRNLDIRFFYDPGALIPANQKRTSIPLSPVAMSEFGEGFTNGVFHPKVWYLQSRETERQAARGVVVVSSANLTISGWAENREALLVREIQGFKNFERIRDFFRMVFNAGGNERSAVDKAMAPLEASLSKNQQDEDWQFLFNDPAVPDLFLREVIGTIDNKNAGLRVWSPYWAEDLPALVKRFQKDSGVATLDMRLYPDFVSASQPRLSEEQLERLKNAPVDYLYRDPEYADPERFSHAKIWRTPKSLGIGSWNFTFSALGITEKSNNMEAGILYKPTDQGRLPSIPKNDELIDISDLEGVAEEETTEEALNSGRIPPAQVFFDWYDRKYRLCWYDDKQYPPKDWTINLPGINEALSVEHALNNPLNLTPNKAEDLILSRLCTLHPKNGRPDEIFYLYVNETKLAGNRPAMRYSDLNELFQHLQTHNTTSTIEATGGGILNVPSEYRYAADEEVISQEIAEESDDISISYFVMFRAFHAKQTEIQQTKKIEALKKTIELAPGNLTEIWEHIKTAIALTENESHKKSNVYIYFLIREFMELLSMSKKQIIKLAVDPAQNWVRNLDDLEKQANSRLKELERQIKKSIGNKKERKASLGLIDHVYGVN